MKPLICPQCGGKITEYSPWQNFVTCGYCETRFVIEAQKALGQVEPVYKPLKTSSMSPNLIISFVVGAFLVAGGIIFIAAVANRKDPKPTYPVYNPPRYSTPAPTPSPTPTPNPNLLEFGGKGTGNGLFQDADAIAVDSKGRIYVADNSLRVQQFNEKGEFLKVWQIPSQTKHYKRARTIQKIAVDDQDRLFVLVGGVVQMWEQNTIELPEVTFHAAPDFMVDFALRSDGGLLMVSVDNEIETLIYMTKSEKVTRRVEGFHTNAADASMSPHDVGLAAIRLAVDGAGNIFSVYALGDLGSYQLSYNSEDFMIFRFTPEAKYVNKFVRSMNSVGIAVDNQSRIYISDDSSIIVYNTSGEAVSTVLGLRGIDAFALDKQNNVYVLMDDKVIKRSAVQ
jgi:DNA-binding transcriptional regulator/RsmH inhibitor MraZ